MSKRVFVLFGAILLSLPIFGQLKFRNFSSKDPFTLIIGLENLLLFDDSILYIKNGMLQIEPKNGLFHIRVANVGLQAFDAYSQNGKVGTVLFDVKRIQEDNLKLGNLGSGGIVKKEEILSNTYLSYSVLDSISSAVYEIISYKLMIIPKKGDLTEMQIKSNTIPSDAIQRILNIGSGGVLLFEEVMVRSQDGTIRKVPGLSFQLY